MMAVLQHHTDDNNTVEWMHPSTLATLENADGNPTWEQAMNSPDKAGYWKACEIELNTFTQKRDAWDVVDHEPWMNVLPSTWAFTFECYPDGSVQNLKVDFVAEVINRSKVLISLISLLLLLIG
jgi:hypothetical protein